MSPQRSGLVLDVLDAMGYGDEGEVAATHGGSGDAGIDGVIREDRLGLDSCTSRPSGGRRRRSPGCRPSWALSGRARSQGDHLHRVALLERRASVRRQRVAARVLVDGERLAELMVDHNVGVTDREKYTVKRVDADYFGEDA